MALAIPLRQRSCISLDSGYWNFRWPGGWRLACTLAPKGYFSPWSLPKAPLPWPALSCFVRAAGSGRKSSCPVWAGRFCTGPAFSREDTESPTPSDTSEKIVTVTRTHQVAAIRIRVFLCAALLCAVSLPNSASAQSANPTSASNPYYGSVTLPPATDQPIQLSRDAAIARVLHNN